MSEFNTKPLTGEEFKYVREKVGHSQDQAAKIIGFENRSSVCRIEKSDKIPDDIWRRYFDHIEINHSEVDIDKLLDDYAIHEFENQENEEQNIMHNKDFANQMNKLLVDNFHRNLDEKDKAISILEKKRTELQQEMSNDKNILYNMGIEVSRLQHQIEELKTTKLELFKTSILECVASLIKEAIAKENNQIIERISELENAYVKLLEKDLPDAIKDQNKTGLNDLLQQAVPGLMNNLPAVLDFIKTKPNIPQPMGFAPQPTVLENPITSQTPPSSPDDGWHEELRDMNLSNDDITNNSGEKKNDSN